jgi:hypothetical protein
MESIILTGRETAEMVAGFAEAIGDVEQTHYGEEDVLDPLLRCTPAAGTASTADLPGTASLEVVRVVDGEPGHSTHEQLARLSSTEKRDLLERVLRNQVGGSRADQPSLAP